jgi:hypothetical protein
VENLNDLKKLSDAFSNIPGVNDPADAGWWHSEVIVEDEETLMDGLRDLIDHIPFAQEKFKVALQQKDNSLLADAIKEIEKLAARIDMAFNDAYALAEYLGWAERATRRVQNELADTLEEVGLVVKELDQIKEVV